MEGYDDILGPRRKGLDISFALEKKDDMPEYKYVNHQLPKQFKESVLEIWEAETHNRPGMEFYHLVDIKPLISLADSPEIYNRNSKLV